VPPEIARRTLAQANGIEQPYVLCGKTTSLQNIVRILETFHRFRHEVNPEMKLVLVGKKDWNLSDIAKTIEPPEADALCFGGGLCENEDLPVL